MREAKTTVNNFYQNLDYDLQNNILADKGTAELIPNTYSHKMIISQYSDIPDPKLFGLGDVNYGLGIIQLSSYNSSAYNPKYYHDLELFAHVLKETTSLFNNNVTMIVSGPPGESNPLHFIATRLPPVKQKFCNVATPLLQGRKGGLQNAFVFYKNQTLCSELATKVKTFVDKNFNYFCNFDEDIANGYAFLVKKNGNTFTQKCTSGKNKYQDINQKITFGRLILLILFLLPLVLPQRKL